MKITFKRLYSKVDDYGIAYNSIVLYESIPIVFTTKCYEDGKCEAIPLETKKYIKIDLWLFTLEFKWIKKSIISDKKE